MPVLRNMPPSLAQQNKGPTVLATCVTLTVVATLFVGARLWVRLRKHSRLSIDDWLILFSILCGHIMLGLTIAAVLAGNGRHFAILTDKQRSDTILYTFAGFCPGILSFGVPKLAVVALLTRITNPSRAHKWFLWMIASGCLLILFGCVIILFAQCAPTRSQWDFSIEGTCWSPWVLIDYSILAGTISAVVDLYLAIYPAFVLYRVRIHWRKKVALSVALGLGSIASAVAIYKSTRLPALASADFSYDTADITVWTSIEGNSIIIAACIPTLRPLFDRILGRDVFGSSEGRQGRSGFRGQNGPGAKLDTIGSKTLRTPRQRGKTDVFGTTLGQDSQDSILSSDRRSGGNESKLAQSHHGILRTHQFTIDVGAASDQS